jgi:hypothetical protein
LAISWPYLSHILTISLQYIGHIWPYPGHISTISWPYLYYVLTIFLTYLDYILIIYGVIWPAMSFFVTKTI